MERTAFYGCGCSAEGKPKIGDEVTVASIVRVELGGDEPFAVVTLEGWDHTYETDNFKVLAGPAEVQEAQNEPEYSSIR